MQIVNYFIKESEIIGIGPLIVKFSTDQVLAQLYQEREMYFNVYTTSNCITVTTNWIRLAGINADQIDQNLAKIKTFTNEYSEAKQTIIELINHQQ